MCLINSLAVAETGSSISVHMQEIPEVIDQQTQPAASFDPPGRPEAHKQLSGEVKITGSQPAQGPLAGAVQERLSQQSAPLPKPDQAEQPSTQKRPISEVLLGQQAPAESGQPSSAVKKQKRIVPTAMTSAPSAPLTARSGEHVPPADSYLDLYGHLPKHQCLYDWHGLMCTMDSQSYCRLLELASDMS